MAKNKNQKTKTIIWKVAGVLSVVGAIFGFIILSRQTEQERPGEAIVSQGQQHIEIGSAHPAYNSNPPTSGWHYASPASWGAYENELPDEQIVHNLEHGGIWISYKGIDDVMKAALEEIGRTNSKIIVSPRLANDVPIAIVSWSRLQKLAQFDAAAIMKFISVNRNKSPEPFAS